jgi:hypothetical protein
MGKCNTIIIGKKRTRRIERCGFNYVLDELVEETNAILKELTK